MKDRLFFPLTVLLVILLVWLAFLPGIGRLPSGAVAGDGVNYDRIVIADDYLNKVISGGDAITRLERGPDGQYLLYVEAAAGALADAPELGPHFRLGGDIELQMAGHRIRVTLRVRPALDRGATRILSNYSTGRAGESGWQALPLVPDFTDVSFEYDVPAVTGEPGVDYLAIRPEVPEKVRALLIEQVVIERLAPSAAPPA